MYWVYLGVFEGGAIYKRKSTSEGTLAEGTIFPSTRPALCRRMPHALLSSIVPAGSASGVHSS